MPKSLQLAVLLGLVVAHDIKTQIETRKCAKLFLLAAKAYEETEAANHAQIAYLCHILDKNEIQVDEFDLLALRYNS